MRLPHLYGGACNTFWKVYGATSLVCGSAYRAGYAGTASAPDGACNGFLEEHAAPSIIVRQCTYAFWVCGTTSLLRAVACLSGPAGTTSLVAAVRQY
ncbi:hypothetical protein AVEN_31682-1 [Araneus ventricosus]|uniref:Uncharacterized protein n=1 Tax=Araneus ventricosus TaxID=182803 RepID=A0A4Y2RNQ2_ARAVE|nr:hypothetical protein AVEN_31682-1 [Araneus ventricosus]